jgi:hypothetical protein
MDVVLLASLHAAIRSGMFRGLASYKKESPATRSLCCSATMLPHCLQGAAVLTTCVL